MKLIANRQLTGSYGTVIAGQEFEPEDNDLARQLVLSGVARKAEPPGIRYEVKVIRPEAPEVSAREPFRDVLVRDEGPAPVDPAGNRVLPEAVLSEDETGTAARSGRRRPARSVTK